MKILLVTGRHAVDDVERHIEAVAVPVKIHICEVDVAAFLSPGKILGELSKLNLEGISTIIVPGSVKGDMSPITKDLGIPCIKGPRNIADLPLVLRKVSENGIKLSPRVPADDLLKEEFRNCMREELNEAYNPKPDKLRIGGKNPVFLGAGITHVIAEIPDAPLLTGEELKRIAGYYLDSGAEVIDIGMISGRDDSGKVGSMVEILRSTVDIPLSIDSLDEREILAAVDAGVDLILSIDLSNYELMDSVNIPAVLIPRNEKGIIPKGGDARISLVEELMKKVDEGIVDLILDPVNLGFTGSIEACIKFRRKHPEMPMMLGAGNITELLDADSVGVNALLAGIASELDIDLIFTTEASVKTRGSVKELSDAVKLMYLSRRRSQPPKDLGIDLLVLKDKRRIEDTPQVEGVPSIEAMKERDVVLEDTVFRIYLDDVINVVYHRNNKPELKLTGDSAKKIYQEIIERSLIKNMEHAAYLGKELGKAEIALKLGKNYIQDEDLF